MDEKVFLVDRQIADRCSLDPNSVPNQICLVSLREFRSILSEQGDGIAVVANENRLGRAVFGTAQHGDSPAAALVGIADRPIAYQPLGNASLVSFLLYSPSMICHAFGQQFGSCLDCLGARIGDNTSTGALGRAAGRE